MRVLEEQFPNDLVVIGVHSAKFPSERLTANIRQAVQREEVRHPVVNDAGFRVWSEYNVRAWPTLVLIDPNGRIAGETSGEILASDLAPQIQAILDQNQSLVDRSPLDVGPEIRLEPEYPLRYPARLWVAAGRLWIADTGHNRVVEVRLDESGPGGPLGGEVMRVFGSSRQGLQDGPPEEASFHHPRGMALRGSLETGVLYVADTGNHAVRAVDLGSGQVRTIAGTGQKAHGKFELGKPTQTPLRSPWALALLEQYLFIAMAGSHQVWILIDEQQLGPFAGNGREALVDGLPPEASFNQPSDLAFGMGYLFIADPEASAIRALPLVENEQTITLVGQGLFEFGDVDGVGSKARLQHAAGLTFSEEDSLLYLADTYNHKIKTLDPQTGEVKTLIGSGAPGMRDGDFNQAQLSAPEGVMADGAGHLYIADTNNHQVRVADLRTRQVHTLVLRGLERLSQPSGRSLEKSTRLNPIQVHDFTAVPSVGASPHVGPGPLQVALDIHLPPGYKRNPDTAALLRVRDEGQMREMSFAAGEGLTFPVDPGPRRDLTLDLTLYYCQASGPGLCLVHDRTLILPLEPVPSGPEQITIPYPIELPEWTI